MADKRIKLGDAAIGNRNNYTDREHVATKFDHTPVLHPPRAPLPSSFWAVERFLFFRSSLRKKSQLCHKWEAGLEWVVTKPCVFVFCRSIIYQRRVCLYTGVLATLLGWRVWYLLKWRTMFCSSQANFLKTEAVLEDAISCMCPYALILRFLARASRRRTVATFWLRYCFLCVISSTTCKNHNRIMYLRLWDALYDDSLANWHCTLVI